VLILIGQSNLYAYESLTGSFVSIVRLGPSELLRGFVASSLRDAPYAGLFVVFYEVLKRETCKIIELRPTLLIMNAYHFSTTVTPYFKYLFNWYSQFLSCISWCYRYHGYPPF
jgi:hypothetical protein